MSTTERANGADATGAEVSRNGPMIERAALEGRYTVECRDADGNLKWSDVIENLVVNVGKNLALDTLLGGSAYTVTGPFMGLSSTGTSTATDTMVTKTGWVEVGGANAPTYSGARKTIAFSAASAGSKASTGTYTFAMTGAGTVGGAFIVLGTGAVNTIDSTAGTLYSCGAFTGGSKTVANGDSLTVTYTASM